MTLGVSNYNSLNGLALITGTTNGYGSGLYGSYGMYGGGYYGGLNDSTYVQNVKDSIANSYDISTTRQSFTGKQSTESMSFSEHCQAIQFMLQQGRSDDALFEFNNMVDEMTELGQYQGYTEKQIKTLAQNQYRQATGSTLIGDIQRYADSSFESGIKNSIPVFNLLAQSTSQGDLISEITGTKKSKYDTAAKIGGSMVGGAAFGTLTVAGLSAAKNLKGGAGLFTSIGNAVKSVWGKGGGKLALIAAGGAAIGAAFCWLKSSLTKTDAKQAS